MQCVVDFVQLLQFLSTPSVRRATLQKETKIEDEKISIHALREEGDQRHTPGGFVCNSFLSTPSVRRATD